MDEIAIQISGGRDLLQPPIFACQASILIFEASILAALNFSRGLYKAGKRCDKGGCVWRWDGQDVPDRPEAGRQANIAAGQSAVSKMCSL
jgi:hypothetical protein